MPDCAPRFHGSPVSKVPIGYSRPLAHKAHIGVYGSFARTLQLPAGVDLSKIKATINKGVLKVVVEKPAAKETKKIGVKAAA
jgi:hypothetical protein